MKIYLQKILNECLFLIFAIPFAMILLTIPPLKIEFSGISLLSLMAFTIICAKNKIISIATTKKPETVKERIEIVGIQKPRTIPPIAQSIVYTALLLILSLKFTLLMYVYEHFYLTQSAIILMWSGLFLSYFILLALGIYLKLKDLI